MVTFTQQLFETVILEPKVSNGQRGALAFFGAGNLGITASHRIASRLLNDGVVRPPRYLGGASVQTEQGIPRTHSTKRGWEVESGAHMSTQRWLRGVRNDMMHVLDGDPQDVLKYAIIFATDKDYPARGCIRNLNEQMGDVCGRILTLFSFSGLPDDQDWLARETISTVPTAYLWPTFRFMREQEPLSRSRLNFGVVDWSMLAFRVKEKLNIVSQGSVD